MSELKITELRIGNIIKDPILPIIVTAPLLFSFYDNDKYINLYQPIPLTEELLINLGFEKLTDKNKGFKQSSYVNTSGFKLYLCFDDGKMTLDFINGITWKHVHELQNLYFTLTGKELTHQKIN